ncbi:hypothetical protein AB7W12_22955 [Providencia rettgeri]
MYHKIIGGIQKKKQKNIKNSIDYLLRNKKPEEKKFVKILSTTTEKDILNFEKFILPKNKTNPYVCGVLSFEETKIDQELKLKICSDFEEILFSGIEKENRPPLLWVEHTDKDGRIELNYLTFNSLADGRNLTVYYDKKDRRLITNFTEIINYENNFSSPLEKNIERNKLINTINNNIPEHKKEIVNKLNKEIILKIIDEEFKDRNDVIKFLESKNIIINRIRERGISIKFSENDKPIALKGDIYEQNRNYADYARESKKPRTRDPELVKSALNAFRADFEEGLTRRYKEHRRRFKNPPLKDKKINERRRKRDLKQNFDQIFKFESSVNTGGVTQYKYNNNVNFTIQNNMEVTPNESNIKPNKREERSEFKRIEREIESVNNLLQSIDKKQQSNRNRIERFKRRIFISTGFISRFTKALNEYFGRIERSKKFSENIKKFIEKSIERTKEEEKNKPQKRNRSFFGR